MAEETKLTGEVSYDESKAKKFRELIAHPEFQPLSLTDKRALLSGVDPDFTDMNDDQIRQFVGIQPGESTPRGGLGYPVSKEEARKIALGRQYGRAVESGTDKGLIYETQSDVGKKFPLRQAGGGYLGNAMSTLAGMSEMMPVVPDAVYGLADFALRKAGEAGLVSPETVQAASIKNALEQNPQARAGGTMVNSAASGLLSKAATGALSTIGKKAFADRAVRSLPNRIGTGITRGAATLLTPAVFQGASEAGQKLLEEKPAEAIPAGIEGVVEGVQDPKLLALGALSGIAPKLVTPKTAQEVESVRSKADKLVEPAKGPVEGVIKKVSDIVSNASKGLLRTNKQIVANLGQFSGSNLEKSNSGVFAKHLEQIKPYYEAGSGMPGFVRATSALLKDMGSTFEPVVKAAKARFTPDALRDAAQARLEKSTGKVGQQVNNGLAAIEQYLTDPEYGNISSDNVLEKASAIHKLLTDYEKPTADQGLRTTPQYKGLKALSEAISEQIRASLQDGKINPDVYSKYGEIRSLADSLAENYEHAKNAQDAYAGATLGEKIFGSTTAGGGAIKTTVAGKIKEAGQHLLGGAGHIFDNQIDTAMERTKGAVKAPAGAQSPVAPTPPPAGSTPPSGGTPPSAGPPPAPASPSVPPPSSGGAPVSLFAPQQAKGTLSAKGQALARRAAEIKTQREAAEAIPPEEQAKQAALAPEINEMVKTVSKKRAGTKNAEEVGIKGVTKESLQEDPQSLKSVTSESVKEKGALTPKGKTYSPEVQKKLDDNKALYDDLVERIKKRPIDEEMKQKHLKAAAMEYAAAKRQITGELTGKESAAKAKKEASLYTGKTVSVNMDGKLVKGTVKGTPFGRVKVQLEDGSTMTLQKDQIGPEIKATTPGTKGSGLTAEQEAKLEKQARTSENTKLKAAQKSGRTELLDVVKQYGLPDAEAIKSGLHEGEPLLGELVDLREFGGKKHSKLFRKDAPKLHALREKLAEEGHVYETEPDMINAIRERIRTGKKSYGTTGTTPEEPF